MAGRSALKTSAFAFAGVPDKTAVPSFRRDGPASLSVKVEEIYFGGRMETAVCLTSDRRHITLCLCATEYKDVSHSCSAGITV